MAAILNFEFFGGKRKRKGTSSFPPFLNLAYSKKNPRCKFSRFYPEVHGMAEKCYISASLPEPDTLTMIILSPWDIDATGEIH